MEPDPDYSTSELFGEGVKELDPAETPVSQLFDRHDRGIYEYDFGDSWFHEIVVEKKLKDTKKNSVPICLGGARHRPPEDVGGVGGYGAFLETIREKKNPEREDMLSWAQKDTKGRLFDPDCFYEVLRLGLDEDVVALRFGVGDDPRVRPLQRGPVGPRALPRNSWEYCSAAGSGGARP